MGWFDSTVGFALNPFGIGDKFTNNLTGGPPKQSFFGGSQEDLDRLRNVYETNAKNANTLGAVESRSGAGMLGTASGYAGQDRTAAYGLMGNGYDIGRSGMENQDQQIGSLLTQAQQRTPSLAQAQLRAAQDENSRRMMGMAAGGRGGNQAAAMRNAGAMASQNALITNQQAGQLRAQEEAQRQQNILAAREYAARAYGDRAGLGYGLTVQGLGAAENSTGQIGQIGNALGNLGVAQQNVGLGWGTLTNDVNKSQLETDRGWASAESAAKSPAAAFGAGLGGVTQLWGGGGQAK